MADSLQEFKQPESIQLTDEADEMLVMLCDLTGLGKSGIIDTAIRFMADNYIDKNSNLLALIQKQKDSRTFPQHCKDALENAMRNVAK